MDLIFGIDLDGCPASRQADGIGKSVLGPQGLFAVLEQALGLPPGEANSLGRAFSWRQALAATIEDAPFFAASFERDPLATALVLLRRRDDLRLAGLAESADFSDSPDRLRDLAAVEPHFVQDKATGFGPAERIARIRERLAEPGSTTGIHTLKSVDDAETVPLLWRQLLDELGVEWPVGDSETPPLPSEVKIFSAQAPSVLARHFGDRLTDLEKSADRSGSIALIVGSGEETLLHEAIRDAGQASLGHSIDLSGSAVFQLPLLLTRLFWKPFHPQQYLEYLMHRPYLLAGSLPFLLGKAINESPGYENTAWNKALEKAKTKAEEQGGDAPKKLKKSISKWLPSPTYDPADGAPAGELAEVIESLGNWAGGVGSHASKVAETPDEGEPEERAAEEAARIHSGLYLALSGRCHSFARSLRLLGDERLVREEWERLLAIWLDSAGTCRESEAELGSATRYSRPAHVLHDVDHVLWWAPPAMPADRPVWSKGELAWLATQGCVPLDPTVSLAAQAARLARPLARCGKTLTIFQPTQKDGEPLPDPPVVTRLVHQLGKAVVVDGEVALMSNETPNDLPVHRLPKPRRFWRLAEPNRLAPLERASFSSLDKELFSPGEWTLGKVAKLEKGRLLEWRAVDNLLRQGSLLHEFVEELIDPEKPAPDAGDPGQEVGAQPLLATLMSKLFGPGSEAGDWREIDEESLARWVEAQWDPLLRDRAAQFLVPGSEATRTGLLHTAQTALWQLLRHLRSAGIEHAATEQEISTQFPRGNEIKGFIDLVVRTEDGRVGVVDLKLGGLTRRKDQVRKNLHLQLAVYGFLHGSVDPDAEVSCAYFILNRSRLLARSNKLFRDADFVAPGGEGDEWQGCWDGFLRALDWRRGQLAQGLIEFPAKGLWGGDDSTPPAGLEIWKAPDDSAKYSPYTALNGWPASKR